MSMKLMGKISIITLLVIFITQIVVLGPRLRKDINKKLSFKNTYAIQNVKTGKDIRVHDAGIEDGRKIILYDHKNWECITWQFIRLEDSSFLLKNLYTEKTFQPSEPPTPGVSLSQKTLGGSSLQYWEFIKQPDNTFLIRLKGTDLYVTISSSETNSDIILMPKENSINQQWRLVNQTPWI